jgi:DNA (cytosine-5)-methyltransferase 1
MKHGSLCTGYGGLDMAAQAVFGGELAWWSDIETGPIKVMQHHTNAPNIGDLKHIDWPAVEPIDVLTAGYPCQPFSSAGKRKGTDDPRHLWPWIAYGIAQLRPRVVVLENVGAHLRRGFPVVAADLAALGYRVAWTLLRASDVGAAHRRERLFIVATDTAREHDHRSRPAGTTGRDEHSDRGSHAVPDTLGGVVREQPRGFGGPGGQGAPLAGGDREAATDWQEYAPAIRRWERCLGRPAPTPSVLGPRGGVKVSPAFGEWLMGLPEGHITDVPDLSINEQLKLVGNGVVPQQAEHAIRWLWNQLNRPALAAA